MLRRSALLSALVLLIPQSDGLAQEDPSSWQASFQGGLSFTSEDNSYLLRQISGFYRLGQSNWQVGWRYTDFREVDPDVSVLGIPLGDRAFISHLLLRRQWSADAVFGYLSGGGGLTAGAWDEGFAGGGQAGVGYRLGSGWSLRAELIGQYAPPVFVGGGALGVAYSF
jgi:hypothetical protein